jgi:hypothetical protein
MASRLQRLNGWRRLWLVATAALAIWFVVLWPWKSIMDSINLGESGGFPASIREEFGSGRCRTYQTEPLEKLVEPAYGADCYHIYSSRKSDSVYMKDNTVPYTLDVYERNKSAWYRARYFEMLGIGAAGTAIASGLVYFLGCSSDGF